MKSGKIILSLAVNYHDSCVALMHDGVMIENLELERITRIKHARVSQLDQPAMEILQRHGLRFEDVDIVATCLHGGLPKGFEWSFEKSPYNTFKFPEKLAGNGHVIFNGVKRPAYAIRHHAAHAAASFFASNFNNDSLVLTFDGGGDYETFVLFTTDGNQLQFFDSRPLNMGMLFTILGSVFYGLDAKGAPGKLMAYAALADPDIHLTDCLFDFFSKCDSKGVVRTTLLREALQNIGLTPNCFVKDSIKARSFMASFQHAFEEYVLEILKETISLIQKPINLCLSGGCALNCVLNRRIATELNFQNVFVTPCCHDGGIAAGLALFVHSQICSPNIPIKFPVPYLGREYDIEAIPIPDWASVIPLGSDIFRWTAEQLASGAIVGWFQGRSEIGPRSLGNRSILARPDRAGIAKYLNENIKHREWYRPFAPVVLADSYSRFFEGPSNNFMSFASECIDKTLSGVNHVDGTSRVQILPEKCNPELEKLIKEFNNLTGLPILLNTSFNRRDEPIVESPIDALRLLESTPLKIVVIGENAVIRKEV